MPVGPLDIPSYVNFIEIYYIYYHYIHASLDIASQSCKIVNA